MKQHAGATRTLQFAEQLLIADVTSLGPKGLSSESSIPAGFSVRAALPVTTTSLQGSGNSDLSALPSQSRKADCTCSPFRLSDSAGLGLETNRMLSTRCIVLHHSATSGSEAADSVLAVAPQQVCSPALTAAACTETRSLVSFEQPLLGGGWRVHGALSTEEQSAGSDT